MYPDLDRNPFIQRDITTVKLKTKLLAIKHLGLIKSVIKIYRAVIVQHHCLNPVGDRWTDRCAGNFHSMHQFTGAKPSFEHIEEVNAMLNKNTPAFRLVPEPMFWYQLFITGIVIKESMYKITEPLFIDDRLDSGIQWILSLIHI